MISKSRAENELAALIAWDDDWTDRKIAAGKGKSYNERLRIYDEFQIEMDNYNWTNKYNSVKRVLDSYNLLENNFDLSQSEVNELNQIIQNTSIESTLPPFAGTIESVISKTAPNIPSLSISGITQKTASINWNVTGDGGSPITSIHYVLKNQDTNQTIKDENLMSGARNSFENNLQSGVNYRAYLILVNAFGNSPENSIAFTTLTTPTAPAPVIIPDGFHQMPDGSIMADSEMYNFIVESDGKVRMIRLTGTNQDYEIKVMADNVESYISRGIARLLTEQERAGVIAPEPEPEPEPVQTFCVNVYNIRDSGSVYSTPYTAITAEKVQELQLTKLVVSCEADYLPTEKQVQDFYGFVPPAPQIDTSINSTMVSQSVGAFILKDGRVKGEILYIANQSFNSFYYNKSITSIIQIKSKSGVTIAIKSNNLNFTETQRDETIFINESAGNFKELTIDFFVWDSPLSMIPFTETKQIQIVDETDVPDPDPFDPQPPATTCPVGFHKDFSGKCVADDPVGEIPRDKLIDTLKGFLFGTVALSLLARKY